MTYSVVARDPDTGELGVAAQSRFFGAAQIVCHGKAGVGVIATQAYASLDHPFRILRALSDGAGASSALEDSLTLDPDPASRQLAVVAAGGSTAAHTGGGCTGWAGHHVGAGISAQGNMLARHGTWDEMVRAFETTTGALWQRLLAAMRAAESCGGDARGRLAAGMLIVGPERVDDGPDDVRLDVRVEMSSSPLDDLERIIEEQRRYGALFEEVVSKPESLRAGREDELERKLTLLEELSQQSDYPHDFMIWQVPVLQRLGRREDATRIARDLVSQRPSFETFFEHLAASGLCEPIEDLSARLPNAEG